MTFVPQASSWVKEKSAEPVFRLQVTDKDSRGSAAWRARYSLRGDEAQHFKIQTDPDTNDGVITVTGVRLDSFRKYNIFHRPFLVCAQLALFWL